MVAVAKRMKPWAEKIVPGKQYPIEDAIGITQELNAWRNAAVDEVKTTWLQRTVEPGVDNERKLLVAQSFLEIEKLYPQMVADQMNRTEGTQMQTINYKGEAPMWVVCCRWRLARMRTFTLCRFRDG
mgnify:CR=1 FL=1